MPDPSRRFSDDIFFFAPGSGTDSIMDFDQGNDDVGLSAEHDMIDFTEYGFASWEELSARIQLTDSNWDGTPDTTYINASGTDTVIIYGVVGMTGADFIL